MIVGLVLLLGPLLTVRTLWPRESAQHAAVTQHPAATESPSSSALSTGADEKEIPCPPDSQILKDYNRSDEIHLYDHLRVGDYVVVWLKWMNTAEEYDPELLVMKRVGTRSLQLINYVFSGSVFCRVHEVEIKKFPRRIFERTGCDYWGRNPPENSPQAQVLRRQQEFFNALKVGDTATVCAMLGPRALREVEKSGKKCQALQARLENILRHLVQSGSSPDPGLVQATSQFAITAGYMPHGFGKVLRWSLSGDPLVWRVTDLQCVTLTGEC